jgi:flagellar basal body-associated protein FliL
MVKLILVGVWACLMTLASTYAASMWKANQEKAAAAAAQAAPNIEYKKTKEFTVPKISDGAIQGYVIAELSYSVDPAAPKELAGPLDTLLLDEAFRYIYADDFVDFNNLKKYDLAKMTKILAQNVNARLNSSVVKDVTIQEFNFMTRSDMKKQM